MLYYFLYLIWTSMSETLNAEFSKSILKSVLSSMILLSVLVRSRFPKPQPLSISWSSVQKQWGFNTTIENTIHSRHIAYEDQTTGQHWFTLIFTDALGLVTSSNQLGMYSLVWNSQVTVGHPRSNRDCIPPFPSSLMDDAQICSVFFSWENINLQYGKY